MDLWWLSDDFSIFDTQSKTPRPIRRSFSNLIVSTNTNTHLPIIENLAIKRYVLLAFSSEKLCIHPCRYFEREVKQLNATSIFVPSDNDSKENCDVRTVLHSCIVCWKPNRNNEGRAVTEMYVDGGPHGASQGFWPQAERYQLTCYRPSITLRC